MGSEIWGRSKPRWMKCLGEKEKCILTLRKHALKSVENEQRHSSKNVFEDKQSIYCCCCIYMFIERTPRTMKKIDQLDFITFFFLKVQRA